MALAETVYNNKIYEELYLVNEGSLKGIACTSDNQYFYRAFYYNYTHYQTYL